MTVCEVCSDNITKYKCPRCSAASCSLACFKTHKSFCSKAEALDAQPQDGQDLQKEGKKAVDSPIPATGPRVDEQLEALFMAYPKFKPALRRIYESTLEQHSSNLSLNRRSHPRFSHGRKHGDSSESRLSRSFQTSSWTPEKGARIGISELQRLQETDDEIAEALEKLSIIMISQSRTDMEHAT